MPRIARLAAALVTTCGLTLGGFALGAVPSGATSGPPVRMFAIVHDHGAVKILYYDANAGTGPAMAAQMVGSGQVIASGIDQHIQVIDQTGSPTSASAVSLNDPMANQQWALAESTFTTVWPTTTGKGIIVAVVDTGVLASHQDLAGSVLVGTDFVSPGGHGDTDPGGHGTHVAGIIAAHANNHIGVAGAAPGVKILPVRVLDANGDGWTSNIAAGIIWAADHHARVINLSLGGTGADSALEEAMNYALGKGALPVVAAGNDGNTGNQPEYPGSYPEALSVGAVDRYWHLADFSNTTSNVGLVAPGVDVLSTWGDSVTGYAWADGTSMATPYVSAAAALVMAARPNMTALAVKQLLELHAHDLGPKGYDHSFGFGYVDPAAALGITRGTEVHAAGGYWVAYQNGTVAPFGLPNYGNAFQTALGANPIVALGTSPRSDGYWLANSAGAIGTFGFVNNYGSRAGQPLNAPIAAMAVTADGKGYWLLGADGGIFGFGDAHFYGSTGGMHLNAPVVSMATTTDGKGYWLVAHDGGIFGFGDAKFHGSLPGLGVSNTAGRIRNSGDNRGYYILANDGGVFSFGDAHFAGAFPAGNAVDIAIH